MARSPCNFGPSGDSIQVMTMKVTKGLELPELALPSVWRMPAAEKDEQ